MVEVNWDLMALPYVPRRILLPFSSQIGRLLFEESDLRAKVAKNILKVNAEEAMALRTLLVESDHRVSTLRHLLTEVSDALERNHSCAGQ